MRSSYLPILEYLKNIDCYRLRMFLQSFLFTNIFKKVIKKLTSIYDMDVRVRLPYWREQ